MKIELAPDSLAEIKADAIIVPVFNGETAEQELLQQLDRLSNGAVAALVEAGELKGKRSEVNYLHLSKNASVARLILLGVGEADKFTPLALSEMAGSAVRLLRKHRVGHAALLMRNPGGGDTALLARLVTEAALLAPYEQNKYQRKEDDEQFEVAQLSLAFIGEKIDTSTIENAIARGRVVAESANFTRDLAVEPGNRLTPRDFAQRAQEVAAPLGIEFEVIDEPKLQEMGMGAIVAVSQGSDEPAQLIIMRYKGSKSPDSQPIALVGKGITFDSGGICLKPREGMWEMKTDMSGGATVIGTMCAIARLKPEIDVIGVIAASENLPSGKAYKPGDVLQAYSGKMIEVIDTDAEGRLVLADALHYTTQQKPACIIDLATLTGACIIALGNLRAAMMGNDEPLMQELEQASNRAGEKVWQLPLDKEYTDMIKSDIADIKNLGGRFAGAITAAAFLKEFVGDVPWAHLDIAGTAWLEENRPEMSKGPTGYGVRTLVEFILSRAAAK